MPQYDIHMDQTKDCTRELIAKAHNNDKEAREKLVTLIDNFVVMIEIVEIEIVQLAQFHIYKSSPLRGTIFNDSQVFRRKKHNITKPQKIRCFLDLLAIYGNSFGFGLSQMHIHTNFFTVFLEISSDMCLFLVEINDFSVLASLMRFCGSSLCSL